MTRKLFPRLALTVAGFFVLAASAGAQQLIIKGMYGMNSGVQPPPGVYGGAFGSIDWADDFKTATGDTLHGPKLTQEVFGPMVMWVSNFKIFGATYGATIAAPFANFRVEFPTLDHAAGTGIALSQLYVVPVSLGWHLTSPLPLAAGGADIMVHYAFYAPTGRYEPGALNNTSLGMWSNEISARLTAFFDKDKQWHGSAAFFYDFNSAKQGQEWRTGNPLTFMGGLGRNYCIGASPFSGWFGIVGYSQWQVTSTSGNDAPLAARLNKSRIFSAGPEFTTLQGALTVRYFWQFGGKFSTQGQGLYLQFAMPF